MPPKKKEVDLSKNLKELAEIARWFDEQEEIDVEQGLQKVKDAAALIKSSKSRLGVIENEFEEIKKDIEIDPADSETTSESTDEPHRGNIPF